MQTKLVICLKKKSKLKYHLYDKYTLVFYLCVIYFLLGESRGLDIRG